MATARAGLAASTVGNRIYTFGGNDGGGGPCTGNVLSTAEMYDIATDTWSPITPPPSPVSHAVSAQKGGNIYLIGGCTQPGGPFTLQTAVGLVQIYDPVTDSWSAGAAMPTPRASHAVGVLGNTIYAIAGYDPLIGNLDVVEAYNRNKDTWSPRTMKPRAVSEVFAASHGGKLYVPGSGAFGAAQAVNEIFSKK